MIESTERSFLAGRERVGPHLLIAPGRYPATITNIVAGTGAPDDEYQVWDFSVELGERTFEYLLHGGPRSNDCALETLCGWAEMLLGRQLDTGVRRLPNEAECQELIGTRCIVTFEIHYSGPARRGQQRNVDYLEAEGARLWFRVGDHVPKWRAELVCIEEQLALGNDIAQPKWRNLGDTGRDGYRGRSMAWRSGHAFGMAAGAADVLRALADPAAELPPTPVLRARLGRLAEGLREAAAFLAACRLTPARMIAEDVARAVPSKVRAHWDVEDEDTAGAPRVAPAPAAKMALDGYRETGRGAVVHDHQSDSFGMHYVTLEEMLADHAALETDLLAFVPDWASVIPLVEQYDPERAYVYRLNSDDDPPVVMTIALPG